MLAVAITAHRSPPRPARHVAGTRPDRTEADPATHVERTTTLSRLKGTVALSLRLASAAVTPLVPAFGNQIVPVSAVAAPAAQYPSVELKVLPGADHLGGLRSDATRCRASR